LNTLMQEHPSPEAGSLARNSFSGLPQLRGHNEVGAASLGASRKSSQDNTLASLSGSLPAREDQMRHPLSEWFRNQQGSSMSTDARAFLTPDPMVSVLSAFYSIPSEYLGDLFNDFRGAAETEDLRRLLDTISDWSATAELYADEHLAQEVKQAINGRQGVACWLHG